MQPNVLFFAFCGVGYDVMTAGLEWLMLSLFGRPEEGDTATTAGSTKDTKDHKDSKDSKGHGKERKSYAERLQAVPRTHITLLVAAASHLFAGAAVAFQHAQWRFVSDQVPSPTIPPLFLFTAYLATPSYPV